MTILAVIFVGVLQVLFGCMGLYHVKKSNAADLFSGLSIVSGAAWLFCMTFSGTFTWALALWTVLVISPCLLVSAVVLNLRANTPMVFRKAVNFHCVLYVAFLAWVLTN